MQIDQIYCIHCYLLYHPQEDTVLIDNCNLTIKEKRELKLGKEISKYESESPYRQYYRPIKDTNIIN